MGTHPDFHFHVSMHNWRKRAREAEAKLARIQAEIDRVEEQLQNTELHTGIIRAAGFTTIRSIMREPVAPNYR